MKVGAVLTALIVVGCGALLLMVDASSTSTAPLAYFFLPLYAIVAILLVWFCVFLTLVLRKAVREWRFANRNANPSN